MRVAARPPEGWERALAAALATVLDPGTSLRPLGAGLDCWAVLAGDDVVIKVPEHDDGAASVARQHRILAALRDRMPVAIPEPLFLAPNPLGPGDVGGYRLVAGEIVDEEDWHRRGLLTDANASAIAAIVDAIASFPAAEAERLGVPAIDQRVDVAGELDELRDSGALARLEPGDARALEARWEAYLADDANFAYEPALVHGDLSLDHLLVEGGRIVGLIDFGDVAVTDPDVELAYLWAEAGAGFVGRIQSCRGRRVDDRLAAKLDFARLRDRAGDVRWAIRYGRDHLLADALAEVRSLLAPPPGR